MTKAKKVAPKRVVKKNTLFPGKARYVGPQDGWFGFVHHAQMFERADCGNIDQRVAYIKSHKPPREVPTRLRHLIYLGEKLNKRIALWDSNNGGRPNQDPELRRAVMAYVRRHIDPLRWNGRSLCYPDGTSFEG